MARSCILKVDSRGRLTLPPTLGNRAGALAYEAQPDGSITLRPFVSPPAPSPNHPITQLPKLGKESSKEVHTSGIALQDQNQQLTANKNNKKGFTPDVLVGLWHEVVGRPRVTKLGASRRRKALARIVEHPDPEFWKTVFEKISRSSFLQGSGDRGWVASFDWVVRNDENILRVAEGAYDDRKPTEPAVGGEKLPDWVREMREAES